MKKLKVFIFLFCCSTLYYSGCMKLNPCAVYNYALVFTNHPLKDGLCIDNNSDLLITLDAVLVKKIPCPNISTLTTKLRIWNGFVNKTNGVSIWTGGANPEGTTINVVATLTALCCCYYRGDLSGCNPMNGAKNIWELKTTVVTARPFGLTNSYDINFNASDWIIAAINCC